MVKIGEREFDKTYVHHERWPTRCGLFGAENLRSRADTRVALVKGNWVCLGRALLHEGEQFNRKMGYRIALGRALYAYGLLFEGKRSRRFHPKPNGPDHWAISFGSPVELEELIRDQVYFGKERPEKAPKDNAPEPRGEDAP